MAKILKIRLGREQTAAKTKYTFPEELDRSKIKVVSYETIQSSERRADVIARGNDHEFIIAVVEDIDAPAFLVSDDIVELTEQEAITLGDTWRSPVVKTKDQNAVNMALSKYALSQALSPEEAAALDPNDPTPGINMTENFTEMLTNTVNKVSAGEQ
jgi:hypothetical protein